MLHRLCGPPSIHLSFNLAAVLPRRSTYCVSCVTKSSRDPTTSRHRLRQSTTKVSNPCLLPTLSSLSVSIMPEGCLRHRYPSRSLRISPLHLEFYLPLTYSSSTVSDAVPRLSPGISHQLISHLRSLLRPVIPINACTLCITAAAGTELASAFILQLMSSSMGINHGVFFTA